MPPVDRNSDEIPVAVGVLVHTTNTLVTTVGRMVEAMPRGELRTELLDSVHVLMEATKRLAEMFPAPEGGKLH